MKKKLFFAAVALVALASCTNDEFIGDVTTPQDNSPSASDAIVFSSASQGSTRANKVGAEAADLLGGKFIVLGVKGDGTGTGQTTVFSNYLVEWAQNTAATTESNTSDWEYVGKGPQEDITDVSIQTIKYWDFSTTAYDFAAYSVGKDNTITSSIPGDGEILASAIDYDNAATAAYTLEGSRTDLTKCYITDMKTVAKTNYKQEVELQFRSLASKVRIALYETIPGYSVKNVNFYGDNTSDVRSTADVDNTDATLIGAFYEGGEYTVTFPHIGSDNAEDPDYNKAHVAITSSSDVADAQAFGGLNYTGPELYEEDDNIYLQRTSQNPSFAGTSTYYQTVLPNEEGVVLELRVNYTLVSTDGSGEEITIHGAKAFVPQVYTKWMPNYAYTYIFKISDNTNGWTNPDDADDETLAGLFPITFDAVVLDSEETGHQTTITTVATPSITTYQRGHVYSATNEYKVPGSPDATAAKDNDAIYAQVMLDDNLVDDLQEDVNSFFYKITNLGKTYSTQPLDWPVGYYTDVNCATAASGTFSVETTYYKSCTEADVMDALNIQESDASGTITGRNGIVLTPAEADYTVNQIPGEDGNWITQYYDGGTLTDIDAGMVAKLSPEEAGPYAYVYDATSTTPVPSPIYTAVKYDSAPTDFGTAGIYYEDPNGTKDVTVAPAATFSADKYYYKKYTNQNRVYGVKVIKIVAGD